MSAGWASGGEVELASAAGGGLPRPLEVHVWHAELDGDGDTGLLVPDEHARAERFAFARLRREWVSGRTTLRRVLAGYLGLDDPRAVALRYGAHGKPALAGRELEFNLAHGGGRLVVAVARAGEAVGVDLEGTTRVQDPLAFAERFFAAGEAARLRALGADAHARAFAGLWTGKEAYVKALGAGLTIRLDDFELGPEPALLRSAGCDPRGPGDWVLATRAIGPDHVCTVAVARRRLVLVERHV